MDFRLPSSPVYEIFQARILKWVAIFSSRGFFQSRDGTCISCTFCIGRRILYHLATQEAPTLTYVVVVVQSLSLVWFFVTLWAAICQASLSFTISWGLLKLMSIESVMLSNYLVLYSPLLLLPSIFPSISIFSNELALDIRWPEYWSFSISISPSNKYSGLISFRIDRFDLLAIQGTQESSPTPQFKSISSSALGLLYSPTLTSIMTTGKAIALTIRTFVGKVMSHKKNNFTCS